MLTQKKYTENYFRSANTASTLLSNNSTSFAFLALLLLCLLISACDNDDHSTRLQGRWLNCMSTGNLMSGHGVEIVFHGASWTVYSSEFSDSSCESPSRSTVVEQGEFKIGGEVTADSGVTANNIDISARFGVIDVYKRYFDMFYIEENLLYFGVKTSQGLTSIINRPTDLDYSYSFRRS